MNAIIPPVMTTNIDLHTPVSDEVIVNRDGSTGLQKTSDLAVQLAATSPLDLGGFQAPLFATVSALNAATLQTKVSAWVFDDPDADKNGVWSWTGAAWVWTLPLPYSISVLVNTGAGTANAILATSKVPLIEGLIVVLPIAATNTASPVTVKVNNNKTFTLRSMTGNPIVPGGLVAGMMTLALVRGDTLRLISDQVSAAIVAAAEAAAIRAENAAQTLDPSTWAKVKRTEHVISASGQVIGADKSAAVIKFAGGAAFSTALVTPVGNTGVYFILNNLSSATITLTTPAGQIVNGNVANPTHDIVSGERIELESDGTNWRVLNQNRTIGTGANNIVARNALGKIQGVTNVCPYMFFGMQPENIGPNVERFANGGMSLNGGYVPTDMHSLLNPAGWQDVNLTVVGAGGRDWTTLTAANGLTVYFYFIVHGTNPALNSVIASLSLSNGAVNLPSGYVTAMQIPHAKIYHQTLGLMPHHVKGGRPWSIHLSGYDTSTYYVIPGTFGVPGTGNYVDIDCSSLIPNPARLARFRYKITGTSGAGSLFISTPGVTDNKEIGYVANGGVDTGEFEVRLSSTGVFQARWPSVTTLNFFTPFEYTGSEYT